MADNVIYNARYYLILLIIMSITESTEIELCHSENEDNDDRTGEKSSSNKYQYSFRWPTPKQVMKMDRSMSDNDRRSAESVTPLPSPLSHNRFRHLYTRLKRQFSIHKDFRPRDDDDDDDSHTGTSTRLGRYKTFSSSMDNNSNKEIEWPDFEKVFDSIPNCLLRTLPGLDSFSPDDDGDDNRIISINDFNDDENHQQMELFQHCHRGKDFRRNAICQKLDESQDCGQLDVFIQQLMLEKLMRTWT